MMRIHCPRHGHDVLIGHRQVLGIDGHGADMTVRWVCWCGQHGSHRARGPVTAARSVAVQAA